MKRQMYLSEYLPRLGQVSIYIDAPDPLGRITGLRFANNTLYLKSSQELALRLPDLSDGSIGSTSTSSGQLVIKSIAHDDLHLVIRINATKPAVTNGVTSFMNLASGSQLWSVKDLLEKTPKTSSKANDFEFLCAHCGSRVLNSIDYKFGEMPLEFWHELMDFWHCHKPHEEHHNHNDKNYNGKLKPKDGFVYIGSSYLLLNSTISACQQCSFSLGDVDLGTGTAKLHKWNLKLAYADHIESYPPHLFVYHSVMDKINSAGLRKFTVTRKDLDLSMRIWISAVGLNICLNGERHSDTLKVLYRETSVESADDVLEVPDVVWASFHQLLQDTTMKLPEKSRKMEMLEEERKLEFQVGYLLSR